MRSSYHYNSKSSPFGGILSLVLIVLFFVGLYWIASKVFALLYYASPVLLVVAAILDYKVITNYVKYVFKLLNNNLLLGLGMVLLTFFGFPVVAAYLAFRAWVRYKLRKRGHLEKETYVEYEEISNDVMDLEELPPKVKDKKSNKYDDLFE